MDRGGGWLTPLILALFLALFWLANPNICSTDLDSPTFDETMFITQGVYILHKGDYSLAIQHPPLSKVLVGLATLGMKLDIPEPAKIVSENIESDKGDPFIAHYIEDYPPDRLAGNPYYIGYHLIYKYNRFDVKTIFFRCRRIVQLMHYILVFLIYFIARRLFGQNAAIVTSALAFFDPNMIAHGHLCTTDMAATLFTFGAFYALINLVNANRRVWLPVVVWGILLGLMCAVKFSCMLFLPIHLMVVLWVFRRELKYSIAAIIIAVVIAIMVCFLVGGFSFKPYADAFKQLIIGMQKGRPSYLLGRYSESGFPLYYFATLLFKMPLALLALVLMGIAVALTRFRSQTFPAAEVTLWLMPTIFLLSTVIFHSNNLGLRHILVIYPFLIMIAASVFPPIKKFTILTGIGVLLTAIFLIETVPAMKNPIPFFNWPSRKAAYEGRSLADSNIDWGQDLGRLSDFCIQKDIRRLRLRYFGTADPYYHLGDIQGMALDIMGPGYNLTPGPEGWYAVSLQKLLAVRARAKGPEGSGGALWWLREMEPYARVGGSIFIYRYPSSES